MNDLFKTTELTIEYLKIKGQLEVEIAALKLINEQSKYLDPVSQCVKIADIALDKISSIEKNTDE